MRLIVKVWITMLFCLALSGPVLAVEPAPRAVLTEAQAEFDPVVEGTPVNHDFTVRNTGDAPLIFGSIKSG